MRRESLAMLLLMDLEWFDSLRSNDNIVEMGVLGALRMATRLTYSPLIGRFKA